MLTAYCPSCGRLTEPEEAVGRTTVYRCVAEECDVLVFRVQRQVRKA